MFKRINHSPALAHFIEFISEFMSKRRGLPIVIGIGIVVISFIIQLIDFVAPSRLLQLLGLITLNIGILTALIGLLLSEPLGK
jgi:uncharacterized membrane protein